MAGIGFFPPPNYAPGHHLTFEEPEHSEWIIITKISQQNSQADEEDVQDYMDYSFAFATFSVQNPLNGRTAYMRVYLQVPHQGTEFFPIAERAKQAAPCGHSEIKAIEAFHEQGSTITPALLAIKHDIQDQQGLVPGGYVVHFIFSRVPGIRLADDRILPSYRLTPHTFFEKFNEIQRNEIRMCFNKEYPKLTAMGWEPLFPWATNLVWNPEFSKLYFVDFREVRETAFTDEDLVESGDEETEEERPMVEIWRKRGHAIAPNNPQDRTDVSKWKL